MLTAPEAESSIVFWKSCFKGCCRKERGRKTKNRASLHEGMHHVLWHLSLVWDISAFTRPADIHLCGLASLTWPTEVARTSRKGRLGLQPRALTVILAISIFGCWCNKPSSTHGRCNFNPISIRTIQFGTSARTFKTKEEDFYYAARAPGWEVEGAWDGF